MDPKSPQEGIEASIDIIDNTATSIKNNTTNIKNLDHDIIIEKNISTDDDEDQVDMNNPRNWPSRKKYINFFLVSAISFMGYFSSAIYMPATEQIREYFNTDLTVVNLSIALFVLILGIAPLFYAPLSERIGRRLIYVVGISLFTVFTILCGTSTNLIAFTIFRLCQGFFACIGMSIGGGSVSDLFDSHERSKAVSLYMFGTIFGPAIAPIIGGFMAQYLYWRSIFYLKTVLGGILSIASFFFLDETLYKPESTVSNVLKLRRHHFRFNPLSTLGLLTKLEVTIICLAVSTAFGWFYLLVTILPSTFTSIYGVPIGQVGLFYLSGGIGNSLGALSSGLISDRLYNWQVKRNNGKHSIEYRLTPMYIGVPFIIIGSLLYGWALHFHLNFFIPLVGYLFYTYGTMLTITTGNTYLVECYVSKSASVVSVNNCLRNIFAMFFSLMAVIIRNGLGDGWTFTICSITCLLMYSPIIIVQRYGNNWRLKRTGGNVEDDST